MTLTSEQQLIAQQYKDIRTLLDLIECLDSCNAHQWWVNQLHAIQHRYPLPKGDEVEPQVKPKRVPLRAMR